MRPVTIPKVAPAIDLKCGDCLNRRGWGTRLGRVHLAAEPYFAEHDAGTKVPLSEGLRVVCPFGHDIRWNADRILSKIARVKPGTVAHLDS